MAIRLERELRKDGFVMDCEIKDITRLARELSPETGHLYALLESLMTEKNVVLYLVPGSLVGSSYPLVVYRRE